jgi:hypothetical protein
VRLLLLAVGLHALACSPSTPVLPQGTWWLEGQGSLGELVIDGDGARVALWGEHWGTPTVGSEASASTDSAGVIWLDFPVDTSAGWAQATLALELGAGRVNLPLGFRPGELELRLLAHEGPLAADRREAAAGAHEAALPGLQAAWAEGTFQLRDAAGVLQGLVVLLPGAEARVQIVSEAALTDGLAPARRRAEGPDQVIAFPVEPQLEDELGLLRLNVPTLQVVLPADRLPHPADRWLQASPGAPPPEELQARLEEVERASLAAERTLLARLTPELASEAGRRRAQEGACPAFAAMGPDWQVLLGDYQVAITAAGAGCAVHLAPSVVQHTRRTAVEATAEGLGEVEVLER